MPATAVMDRREPQQSSRKTKSSSKSSSSSSAKKLNGLDEYAQSMRQYLDQNPLSDMHLSSREASPEFCWRDLPSIAAQRVKSNKIQKRSQEELRRSSSSSSSSCSTVSSKRKASTASSSSKKNCS